MVVVDAPFPSQPVFLLGAQVLARFFSDRKGREKVYVNINVNQVVARTPTFLTRPASSTRTQDIHLSVDTWWVRRCPHHQGWHTVEEVRARIASAVRERNAYLAVGGDGGPVPLRAPWNLTVRRVVRILIHIRCCMRLISPTSRREASLSFLYCNRSSITFQLASRQ